MVGVLVRALGIDPTPLKCEPDTVTNVYMNLGDHGRVLREALSAAEAMPWLEGRDAPGFLAFGEPCSAKIQCDGDLCDGATETAQGTCNVDCKAPGRLCPSGLVCSPAGKCETEAKIQEDKGPDTSVGAASCAVSSSQSRDSSSIWAMVVFSAAIAGTLRSRRTRNTRS
jgi:hypothetical protein